MAYCTNTDVLAEFKSLTYNASSNITSAKVDEFISQADSLINAKIGQIYSTPVSGATEALKLLKMISVFLVADRVSEILITRTGNAQTDQTSKGEKSYYDRAMGFLDEIVAGDLPLSDATLLSAGGGVSSYSYSEGEEHTFEKGTEQW